MNAKWMKFSAPGRLSQLVLAGLVLSLLAACATPGSEHTAPALRTAQATGLSGDMAGTALTAQAFSLGDAKLAALLEQAWSGHPNMQAAQARVERAAALAGLSEATSGPQANVSADLTRQHYSANGLIPKPIAGQVWNSGTLQIGGSWAPDFFGQHKAELAAALGQARAAQAEQAAVANALGQQVARLYVQLARQLAQRDLLAEAVRLREDGLALTRQRVQAGLDDRLVIGPVEVAWHEQRQQLLALEDQIQLSRRQLAVLCGLAPQALGDLSPGLSGLNLPDLPPTSQMPGADLLGRRPEVVAARWRVEAAVQDSAAARAQFYPNISLGAFVGFNALGLNRLVEHDSQQWGLAPALRLPLFDGGRLRAQWGVRQAERDAAIAQYNAQVLEAAREAVDALGSLAAWPAQQSAQAAALHAASAQADLARQRQSAGLGGRLPLINAQLALLAQRQAAANLSAQRLDTGLALVKALGGGWTESPAPATTNLKKEM